MAKIQEWVGWLRGVEAVYGEVKGKKVHVVYRAETTSRERIREKLGDSGFPAG